MLDARMIDEVLAESFPASDPPSWTPGIVRPDPVRRVAEARPTSEGRTLTDALVSEQQDVVSCCLCQSPFWALGCRSPW
jgi:hypothetical protein